MAHSTYLQKEIDTSKILLASNEKVLKDSFNSLSELQLKVRIAEEILEHNRLGRISITTENIGFYTSTIELSNGFIKIQNQIIDNATKRIKLLSDEIKQLKEQLCNSI